MYHLNQNFLQRSIEIFSTIEVADSQNLNHNHCTVKSVHMCCLQKHNVNLTHANSTHVQSEI